MSPLIKNIIMAVGVLLVVGIVLFVLPKDDPSAEAIRPESDAVRKTARILADTTKIGSFDMSGNLLRDARFSSLKRVSDNLVDVGTGRSNPFEVIR